MKINNNSIVIFECTIPRIIRETPRHPKDYKVNRTTVNPMREKLKEILVVNFDGTDGTIE